MAGFNEGIKVFFGGDTTQLRASLGEAQSLTEKFAQNTTKQISKIAGLGQVIKGAFVGLGIASVSQIVDKIVDSFRKAAENAKELERLTSEVAKSNIELARSRLDSEQKLTLMIKDRERLEKSIAENKGKTDEDIKRSLEEQLELNKLIKEEQSIIAKIEDERAERQTRLNDEFFMVQRARAKANEEIAEEEKKKREKIAEEEKKRNKERVELDQKLRDQKLESLKPEERILEIQKDVVALKQKQAKLDGDSNEFKALQVDINDKNKSIEEERLAIAQKLVEEEKKLATEKSKSVGGSPFATQGVFRDTSDESLADIIRREKTNLARNTAAFGQFSNLSGDIANAQTSSRLGAAQRELDFRNRLRQDFAVGGESQARRNFMGDPRDFDRMFAQFVKGQNTAEKQLDVFKQIEQAVRRGIPVVFQGTDT